MFRLIHFSDPHLGPLPKPRTRDLLSKRAFGYANWRRSRNRVHDPKVTETLVRHAMSLRPDHIAITGDLVNIALPLEFDRAARWLDTIGPPERVSVVPGNHDAYVALTPAQGLAHWARYMVGNVARPGEPDFPYLKRFGEVSIIGASSGIPTKPLMATGRLGPEQRAAIRALLEAEGERGQCRVVLIHHPPHPGGASRRKHLTDAASFCDVLQQAGAELVLHGHNHRSSLTWLKGPDSFIPAIGVPSLSVAIPSRKADNAGYHMFDLARDAEGGRDWSITFHRFEVAGGSGVRQIGEAVALNSEEQGLVSMFLKATGIGGPLANTLSGTEDKPNPLAK